MSIAANDVFRMAEGVAFTEIPDGLAVNDMNGEAIHFLNPVAAAVFLLCDGGHDANAIAQILKEEFGLADMPLDDVIACLTELEANAVICVAA